jgi:phospholipase C
MKMFRKNAPGGSRKLLSIVLACLLALTAAAFVVTRFVGGVAPSRPQGDIHAIKHVVVIMQENRSFDSYFGTYPGADGIPMQNGVPTICVNDPKTNQCVKPFHDSKDLNHGGPHSATDAINDIDGGKMDGFILQVRHAQQVRLAHTNACQGSFNPDCPGSTKQNDVMGYHDSGGNTSVQSQMVK